MKGKRDPKLSRGYLANPWTGIPFEELIRQRWEKVGINHEEIEWRLEDLGNGYSRVIPFYKGKPIPKNLLNYSPDEKIKEVNCNERD